MIEVIEKAVMIVAGLMLFSFFVACIAFIGLSTACILRFGCA